MIKIYPLKICSLDGDRNKFINRHLEVLAKMIDGINRRHPFAFFVEANRGSIYANIFPNSVLTLLAFPSIASSTASMPLTSHDFCMRPVYLHIHPPHRRFCDPKFFADVFFRLPLQILFHKINLEFL